MALSKFCESKEEIEKSGKTEVFLVSCGCNLPVFFVSHNWFVISRGGLLQRWESGYTRGRGEENWGYLRRNDLEYLPFQGIQLIPGIKNLTWKARIVTKFEGEVAEEMAKIILNSPKEYPFTENYSLLGPNSNTFVAWVLSHFSDGARKMPRNALGKNYKLTLS